MGSRSELQGTSWHYEQIQKTCKDGSKHCIYNQNGKCICKPCKYLKLSCRGKGECDWFESKIGMPKSSGYNKQKRKVSALCNPQNAKKGKIKIMDNSTKVLNDKHKKFLEIAEKRVNTIIEKIETLENLSNKNSYEYTEAEVDKMFKSIETALESAKESFTFKTKNRFKF